MITQKTFFKRTFSMLWMEGKNAIFLSLTKKKRLLFSHLQSQKLLQTETRIFLRKMLRQSETFTSVVLQEQTRQANIIYKTLVPTPFGALKQHVHLLIIFCCPKNAIVEAFKTRTTFHYHRCPSEPTLLKFSFNQPIAIFISYKNFFDMLSLKRFSFNN